eukprot:966526_1
MFVNSAPVRGASTATTVFNAVCAGFALGSEPFLCSKCYGCSDIGQCIKEGDGNDGNDSNGGNAFGVSKQFFGMALLIVCSVFGAAAYWHLSKPIDKEVMRVEVMRDEGCGILSE